MDGIRVQPGGLVRQIDGMGRVVLPKEWRDSQGIMPGTDLELIPGQGGALLVRRYAPAGGCVFCGGCRQLQTFSGRRVCHQCLETLGRRETAQQLPVYQRRS